MAKPKAIRPVSVGGNIKFICYAGPGAGKTVLAGSSSKPTLIIRPPMDHTDSLAVRGSAAEEWVIDDWTEMEEAYEYLKHEGQDHYHWVSLDSISIWQDSGLDDVFEDTIARKGPERANYNPDKGEYGVNMYRLAKWIRHLCALDINVMITAHPFASEDEDGDLLMMPYIQGKMMPEKICGYMNLVGLLKVVEPKGKGKEPFRALVTDRAGKWYAKDQFDAFGGRIIEPNLDKIEDAIEEAKSKTSNRKTSTRKKAATRKRSAKSEPDVSWDDV